MYACMYVHFSSSACKKQFDRCSIILGCSIDDVGQVCLLFLIFPAVASSQEMESPPPASLWGCVGGGGAGSLSPFPPSPSLHGM